MGSLGKIIQGEIKKVFGGLSNLELAEVKVFMHFNICHMFEILM